MLAPKFCAGFTVEGGEVIATAPILYRALMGRTLFYAQALCKERGWECDVVEEFDASA